MADLELTNVVTISVSASLAGIGNFNKSNLGLFTRETPGGGFGSLGYKLYLEPTAVATDFGTGSKTALMAQAVFSQQPNILAGKGYLAVIPFVAGVDAQQTITPSGTAASGHFALNYAGKTTSLIQWNDTSATIQAALRLLPGLALVTVTGSIATTLVVDFASVGGVPALLTVSSDTLATSGPVAITLAVTATQAGTNETLDAAITRTKDLVQYFAAIAAEMIPQTVGLAAAAVIQALNKLGGLVTRTSTDTAAAAYMDLLRTGSFKKTRGLYYNRQDLDIDALVYLASYFGRALSTDFTGSNTTETMHLKDMIGVQPDSSMTQTLLTACQAAGVDVYASFQGVPKLFTSGANGYYDDVYNQEAFVADLTVAGFNALAEASTKLPQTEEGMSVLKAAYRQVCEQYVGNQYLAPGSWNSSTFFGNQKDFIRNITERGYYIYSAPVALQSSADRAARLAPLIQIAIKEAGAIHSSSVVVYINQ